MNEIEQRREIAREIRLYTEGYDLNNPLYDAAVKKLRAFDRDHKYWPNKLIDGDLIDLEFGRLLGDAELVSDICCEYGIRPEQWVALPHRERVLFQIDYIAPMPYFER